jgi:hypothetical protein
VDLSSDRLLMNECQRLNMKTVNSNPETVICTENKSVFLLVTNAGKGYKQWKLTHAQTLVFSH